MFSVSNASAEALTFTKLTGVTGGQIAGTGVYRADLASLTTVDLITQFVITDDSHGFGGFTGQFSGFDLDAIVVAATSVDTAAEAKTLVTQPRFNYFPAATPTSPGVLFTPGTQRAPTDPKLFGSVLGTPVVVDPTIATFGAFDANATIFAPFVKGFATMGDDGVLTFNLATPIDTTVPDFHLWLYIGEVGDNGEQATGGAFDTRPPAIIGNLSVQATAWSPCRNRRASRCWPWARGSGGRGYRRRKSA